MKKSSLIENGDSDSQGHNDEMLSVVQWDIMTNSMCHCESKFSDCLSYSLA